MTPQQITAEITRIISDLRATLPKGGRKQYPVAKHQVSTLTELGIIDAMPAGFGYSDAAEVIKHATTGKTSGAFMNAHGEGEDWSADATALFKLLNPAPVEPAPALTDEDAESVIFAAELALYGDAAQDHFDSYCMDEVGEYTAENVQRAKAMRKRGSELLAKGYRVKWYTRHTVEVLVSDDIKAARANGALWVGVRFAGHLATTEAKRVVAVFPPATVAANS